MTLKLLTGGVAAALASVVLIVVAATGSFIAATSATACTAQPTTTGTLLRPTTPELTQTAATAAISTTVPATSPAGTGSAGAPAACADGSAVLARAATWLTAWNGGPVPYLSSTDPGTWLNGYRRDCSGYASMALGLPGPGLDTTALAATSTPITKTDLRAGDLLINPLTGPAGHVVIFDRWTDPTMTTYLGYEQAGDGGTHHRAIPYPYFNDYRVAPYRPAN